MSIAYHVIVGGPLYHALIAEGWLDTGFRRYWCGGELVTTILEQPDEEG
jgi:hypothetical protein